MAQTQERALAPAEREDLLARANSGDPEAFARLREDEGDRESGDFFHQNTAIALELGGIGATRLYDRHRARIELENIKEGLMPREAGGPDLLLAQIIATNFAHEQLTLARFYDLQRQDAFDRMAHRDQSTNHNRASSSFIRAFRTLRPATPDDEPDDHRSDEEVWRDLKEAVREEILREERHSIPPGQSES